MLDNADTYYRMKAVKEIHSKGKIMIYTFRQNNSGGFYKEPAKFIVVKNADDNEVAVLAASVAGMYTDGVSLGTDYSCCGDRWYGIAEEHDTLDDALGYVADWDGTDNSVPQYMVADASQLKS